MRGGQSTAVAALPDPRHRPFAAVDFKRQTVFAPGAHLRNAKAAFAAVVKAEQDGANVFGGDPLVFILRIFVMRKV